MADIKRITKMANLKTKTNQIIHSDLYTIEKTCKMRLSFMMSLHFLKLHPTLILGHFRPWTWWFSPLTWISTAADFDRHSPVLKCRSGSGRRHSINLMCIWWCYKTNSFTIGLTINFVHKLGLCNCTLSHCCVSCSLDYFIITNSQLPILQFYSSLCTKSKMITIYGSLESSKECREVGLSSWTII